MKEKAEEHFFLAVSKSPNEEPRLF